MDGEKIKWAGEDWLDDNPLSSRELKYMNVHQQVGYLLQIEVINDGINQAASKEPAVSDEAKSLLKKYYDIFEVPITLPPFRKQDHFIHTNSDSNPVSVRPYRYPQYQKWNP